MGFNIRAALFLGALAVSALACGTNKDNHLLSGPNQLSEVHGPNEDVMVQGRNGSLYRLNLSDASMTLVGPPAAASSEDSLVRIYFEDPMYVVVSEAGERRVEGVPKGEPKLSPDNSKFFVLPKEPLLDLDGQEIWVVTVADGSFQHFKIGPHDLFVEWSANSEAVLYRNGLHVEQQIDATTGVPSDALPRGSYEPVAAAEAPSLCEAHGFDLGMKDSGGKVKIILVPTEDKSVVAKPRFSNLPRVLVVATSYPWSAHSRGFPDSLASYGFTKSCTHHLFTLGRKIYLGNLATGTYAYLASGQLRRSDR